MGTVFEFKKLFLNLNVFLNRRFKKLYALPPLLLIVTAATVIDFLLSEITPYSHLKSVFHMNYFYSYNAYFALAGLLFCSTKLSITNLCSLLCSKGGQSSPRTLLIPF